MKKQLFIIMLICNFSFGQDGNLDVNFNSTLDLYPSVQAVKTQSNGKILIGGSFNSSLERLNNDGSVDSSFYGSNTLSGTVYSIDIQNDNKIIVGGAFDNKIKRLNSDGSIDNTFNCNVQGSLIRNIKIVNNGKILICGNFTDVNGNPIYGIARLNSDGSLDTSFNLNLPQGITVWDFGIQSDGKIIVSGEYSTPIIPYLIFVFSRYNLNNTLDTTFNIGGSNANSQIADIDISIDDKIMISGGFSTFNNQQRQCLARLNSNGTLDNTFNSYNFPESGGTTYAIFDVKSLNDGKYIISGNFRFYQGQSSSKIAKLNNDGTIDNTFNIGTGANDIICETEIQNDGKIVIVGNFTSFNHINKRRIARLDNTVLSINEIKESTQIKVYPNPTQGLLFFENINTDLTLESLKLFNAIGQEIKTYKTSEIVNNSVNLIELPNGIYYLQMNFEGEIITKEIIKR